MCIKWQLGSKIYHPCGGAYIDLLEQRWCRVIPHHAAQKITDPFQHLHLSICNFWYRAWNFVSIEVSPTSNNRRNSDEMNPYKQRFIPAVLGPCTTVKRMNITDNHPYIDRLSTEEEPTIHRCDQSDFTISIELMFWCRLLPTKTERKVWSCCVTRKIFFEP